MFCDAICEFCIGPSMFLPDSIWIMAIGQFSLGIFVTFFIIPCLPEMIEDVKKKYPHKPFEASDISSGVFNAMLGFGSMLSPLYGSYMTAAFGFRFCTDTVGYSLLAYSIAYFVLCIGWSYCQQKKEILRNSESAVKMTSNDI